MKEKDIYDIIVENATKEWYLFMSNNHKKENWETPKYSGSQIEKAGKILANTESLIDETDKALEILNNWRASHAYPLQVITNDLKQENPHAIVVQRLKRLDSIVGKLQRNPKMNLYKMQDLGGCRVIVDSIEDVYKSLNSYKASSLCHIFKKENDYIQKPKESGYRSFHMVYQYYDNQDSSYNKNIFIEIQFRTKLQHIWATAVEVMGIYTNSQLKASIGDESVLRFFVLTSSIFAQMENTPICPNTINDKRQLIKELKEIDNELNIVSRLSAISKAIQYVSTEKVVGKGYYILQLNFKKKVLKINGFNTNQISLATEIYNKIEYVNNPDMDAVLVSATSFDELKAAYPNYFTDISKFVSMMRNLFK